MGLFGIKDDDPTAGEGQIHRPDLARAIADMPFKRWHYLQSLAVIAVFLAAGTTTASLSWIEDDVRTELDLTPAQELPIVFTSLSAVTMGLFMAGAVSDAYGRRKVCLAGLWGLLVFQMSIGAAQTTATIALTFGLRGFSLHFGEDVAKGYLTEVLPAAGRGRVLNLMHAGWQLGGVIFSCITLYTTKYSPLAVLSALSVLLALALFLTLTIESPLWIDRKRGPAAGLEALRDMYRKCNVEWPYGDWGLPDPTSPRGVKRERQCTKGPDDGLGEWAGEACDRCGTCCNPRALCAGVRRAYGPLLGEHREMTALITVLYISLQLGTWSNDTWLKRILGESGKDNLQTAASFMQYSCKFFGAILGGMIVERTGRKLLLIPCYVLVAIGTALIGFSTTLEERATSTRLFFSAMVLVYVPVEVLSSTLGTYTYEIFPTRVRIASLGVARGVAGVLGTCYASLGPVVMGSLGPAALFYINAGILVCGAFGCLLIKRDTTGAALT